MKRVLLCLALALAVLAGAQLVAQGPQVRGVLLTDASRDETSLWLGEDRVDLRVDAAVIIESRDGTYSGVYTVRHILDGHLILQSPLREPYVAGSRVLQ